MRSGAIAGIVIGVVAIGSGFYVLFVYCLKKRIVNGKIRFVCRKSTSKFMCFHKKPLTLEENEKKKKRK